MLCIIPARGGSKRLPGKNLLDFDGETLLARTIAQARSVFATVLVSSEDEAILNEAHRCGAIAFYRPRFLATDEPKTGAVVAHVLHRIRGHDWFCLLQVTSPLRLGFDIENCRSLALVYNKPVISTYQHRPNGAVYIRATQGFAGDLLQDALHYEMPKERSIDIDTWADYEAALHENYDHHRIQG